MLCSEQTMLLLFFLILKIATLYFEKRYILKIADTKKIYRIRYPSQRIARKYSRRVSYSNSIDFPYSLGFHYNLFQCLEQ